MIRLTGIQKTYGDTTVLDIPELHIAAGGMHALIGPNGCGKSTLLRIVAGVLQADAGECLLSSEAMYLPQRPYGFRRSVLKNVTLALEGEDAEVRAKAALAKVGLSDMLDKRGDKLSGGETQRMAFARLIADAHDLILLDEPTSATDIAGSDAMESALTDYVRETGATVLFSTHALSQAMRLAQDVIVLTKGQVVERGCPQEVLKNPQHPATQEFLAHWVI